MTLQAWVQGDPGPLAFSACATLAKTCALPQGEL